MLWLTTPPGRVATCVEFKTPTAIPITLELTEFFKCLIGTQISSCASSGLIFLLFYQNSYNTWQMHFLLKLENNLKKHTQCFIC